MRWEPDLIDIDQSEIKYKPKGEEIKKEFQQSIFKKNEGKLILLLAFLLAIIIIATMYYGGWDLIMELIDNV